MKKIESVQVNLWDKVVGYIALADNGIPQFEYDPEFKKTGLEISPIELPLATTTIYTQHSKTISFHGLPGVMADCLPDRFGMRVIEDFYRTRYQLERHEVDVIKRLLYVGNRAIGALEFIPAVKEGDDFLEDQYLEIQNLRKEAKKTIEGKADLKTAEIMRVGGSAGGAQAKALVDYNPDTQEIRSGFSEVTEGFIPCMIKFDGVREGVEENCYGRLEYTYCEMARRCHISVPKTYLLEENGRAHFIIERFDRTASKEKKYHYASLCGILKKDYVQKHSCTYEEYFQATQFLTQDISQVVEAFKLAVFNILFRNQDDHTKNFGFLMDKKGRWKVSPAFDLNYVYDFENAKTHQMKLNEKDDDFEMKDFIESGKKVGLKEAQMKKIIKATLAVSDEFINLGLKNGLEEDFLIGIKRRFRKMNG